MKISKFIQQSPIMPLIMTRKLTELHLEQEMRKLEINTIDGLVLAALFFEARYCRPSEIAFSLELSRSQISQSLRRLELEGFVERSLSKQDMRSLNLRLTSIGKSKSQKVIKVFDELTRTFESILGKDASEKMAVNLYNLNQKMNKSQ